MKSVIFFAALAAAAPLNKRDVVYQTTTEEVIDTVWSTTTVWVDPTPAGQFFETYQTPATTSAASSSVIPAVQSPSSQAPPSSTSVDIPISSTYVAPTTTQAPPTTTQALVAATSAAPATTYAASSSSSSGTTQGTYSGDGTWYDVSVGAGSCGWQGSNSQNLVAVASDVMNNGANPNANPLCGKTINIYYQGGTHQATIYDTCPTCDGGSLDMTQTLFQAVAPNGDGRVHGVSWSLA